MGGNPIFTRKVVTCLIVGRALIAMTPFRGRWEALQ
jgi:hypothetical protein